jgi:putative tricarboxylic transport membrane protein
MNYSALSGIISVILGAVYAIQAYNLPRASIGKPMAPLIFPLGLGVLMIIFGTVQIIRSVRVGEFAFIEEMKGKKHGVSYSAKIIAFTCFIAVVYALLFNRIGYVFSTIFFLGSLLFAVNGVQRWKTNLAVSIVFSLSVYVLFSKVLGLILPRMPYIGF